MSSLIGLNASSGGVGYLRRFPVTLLLLSQFVPFAVIPAYLRHNPHASFVSGLVLTACLSSLAVEATIAPLHRRTQTFDAETPVIAFDVARGARIVAVVALSVIGLGIASGLGSYGVGINRQAIPDIAPLLTPLRPWSLIAVGLFLYAWRVSQISYATTARWIGAIAAAEVAYGLANAIIATAASTLFAITAICIFFKFLRPRSLLVAMLLSVVVWPSVADYRNQQRVQQSGIMSTQSTDLDSRERLRMDVFIGAASRVDAPVDIGQPSLADIAHYGVIPRVLDPQRPQVATGRQFNRMLGGSRASSYTFMLVGNVWVLTGTTGLVVYSAVVALMLSLLLVRGVGPLKMCAIGLALQSLVWMGATYPDNVIGFIQSQLSLAVAWFVIRHTRLARDSTPSVHLGSRRTGLVRAQPAPGAVRSIGTRVS